MASVPSAILLGVDGQSILAVALGLLGVMLARTVFVDRENRKLGRRQKLRETLPLTGVAALISGVLIYDNQMGYSTAAMTGLGVGWTAILLLDVIGKRIIDPSAGVAAKDPPDIG